MIDGKKVLCITLARGGSSRVYKKNIALLAGTPLLNYTIDAVNLSNYIDKYIIATDDKNIEKIAIDSGVECFRRKVVSNTQTSAEGLLEVLDNISGYDYIIEVMCTNPLKAAVDIDGVISKLHNTKADSVVSVVRIWDHHPSRVKHIENDQLVDFYPEVPESRRQDLTPAAYVRNGSVYAMTYNQIINNKVRLGKDTRPYIMPEERSINIDEPIDLKLAELLIFEKELVIEDK